MVDELNIIVTLGMKTKLLTAEEMLLAGEVILFSLTLHPHPHPYS